MIRFGIVLIVSALVVGGLTWGAYALQWIDQFPSFFYQTLIFLVFSTTTIFAYLHKINKPDFFVQLYLLTMAVKLLAYGAYNLIMIIKDNVGASVNVVFFMMLYVIFTVLEIAFLYRKIAGSTSA
ncbi:MAG: hypothetical protein OEV74_00550 [Cyclobacteriaceae bacterium]|nr:hypothetical protein [Cyclobacteriaceae bacterium]MDH4294737.1 hypothetical protein [Cyclobacteriaceae bacterium]MDH5247545.1 hypothetical protein [Cyclobacteriaceae bacterium]